MGFYTIIPGPKASGGSGTPLASDVNQFSRIFTGAADAGTLSLAPYVSATTTSPVATAIAGTSLSVGTYYYALTFVTGHVRDDASFVYSGETDARKTVGGGGWTVTTTSGNQSVSITGIPVPTSGTVIAKRIYRTVAGGGMASSYKLVAEIDPLTTSYVDSVPDASLGTATAPSTNTTGTRFKVPAVWVTRSSAQSIPTSTDTEVVMTTESFDTDDLWAPSNPSGRVIVTSPGKYLVIGNVYWANNTTGLRLVMVQKNNSGSALANATDSAATTSSLSMAQQVMCIVDAAYGESLSLRVRQESGGALSITYAQMWVLKVA